MCVDVRSAPNVVEHAMPDQPSISAGLSEKVVKAINDAIAKDKKEFRAANETLRDMRAKSRQTRLWTAGILLSLGVLCVLSIYWLLPGLSRGLLSVNSEAIQRQAENMRQDIKSFQNDPSISAVGTKLDGLDEKVTKAKDGILPLATHVRDIQSKANEIAIAQARSETRIEELKTSAATVERIKNEAFPPSPSAGPDGKAIPLTTGLEAKITSLQASFTTLQTKKNIDTTTSNKLAKEIQDISKLLTETRSMLSDWQAPTKALSDQASQYTAAKGALDTQTDKLKSIETFTESLQAVKAAGAEMKEFQPKLLNAGTKLEKAAVEVEAFARHVREAGALGSGPAVYLTLGVAAMFLTFGLSSLLKWAKSFEEEEQEEDAIFKTELVASIAAAFAEHGHDPAAVLDNIRGSLQSAEMEAKGAPFPAAKTTQEILRLLREIATK